jgi:hypothetical protein
MATAGLTLALAVATVGGVVGAIPSTTTNTTPSTTSTTTTTTTTSTTTSTTTTTTTPPLVVDLPSSTPDRGTQIQATDTLPPPPTTTTLPPGALPPGSGEGRRLVYSKTMQRAWVVEADDTVSRTHLVSGRRTWNQPLPGTYSVFSKSGFTCNIRNPDICWRYMVRFTKGPDGDNIGFHEIPNNNGVPVQTIAQLGQALSNGCIRQATPDALYVYDWAPVGTKVVVLP